MSQAAHGNGSGRYPRTKFAADPEAPVTVELPGTPLMSPRSAPEESASSDSRSVGQCTACAEGKIWEGGCPGGQTANRAAQMLEVHIAESPI